MFEESGATVKVFNADVDDATKKEISNVNDAWNVQCVIINNMITCGVNYEVKDFDYMYIFPASFNSPRDLIQVSYRARHLSSGIINVAFLPSMTQTTFLKDCDAINCPIYTRLYNDISTEKYSPLKNSFKKFCIEAHYKQIMDKNTIEKSLILEIKQRLETNQFCYTYESVEDIDLHRAEVIKENCFAQCATMYEKVQLQKYYYQLQFMDKTDIQVADAWNNKLFFFIKQIGQMMINPDCLFRKIAKFNDFELFPSDITKVKLNDELLDQIFKEFSFKKLSKSSSTKILLKEVYNLFFKHTIVCSTVDKNRNVSYFIHPDVETYAPLYMQNLCLHEIGTWIPIVKPFSDEVDEEPELC
jgi:hypothetical protein